jgi:hypothetical protein
MYVKVHTNVICPSIFPKINYKDCGKNKCLICSSKFNINNGHFLAWTTTCIFLSGNWFLFPSNWDTCKMQIRKSIIDNILRCLQYFLMVIGKRILKIVKIRVLCNFFNYCWIKRLCFRIFAKVFATKNRISLVAIQLWNVSEKAKVFHLSRRFSRKVTFCKCTATFKN